MMTSFVYTSAAPTVSRGRRKCGTLPGAPNILRRSQLRGPCRRDGQGSAAGIAVLLYKPADALVDDGALVAYPPETASLHHEAELVVAVGESGVDVAVDDALSLVYGYAAAMT